MNLNDFFIECPLNSIFLSIRMVAGLVLLESGRVFGDYNNENKIFKRILSEGFLGNSLDVATWVLLR